MIAPGRDSIDVSLQIKKLRKSLRFPVSNIVFGPPVNLPLPTPDNNLPSEYAKVYVNDVMVGTIEFIVRNSEVFYISYSNDRFDWQAIYDACVYDIFPEIAKAEPLANRVDVHAGLLLDVKDNSGNIIKKSFCHFADGKWNVMVTGLDIKRVVKVVEVKLDIPALPGTN